MTDPRPTHTGSEHSMLENPEGGLGPLGQTSLDNSQTRRLHSTGKVPMAIAALGDCARGCPPVQSTEGLPLQASVLGSHAQDWEKGRPTHTHLPAS